VRITPEERVDVRRMKRPPTHPGEILVQEFLSPMGLTQTEAARRMGISVNRLNELVRGKRDRGDGDPPRGPAWHVARALAQPPDDLGSLAGVSGAAAAGGGLAPRTGREQGRERAEREALG